MSWMRCFGRFRSWKLDGSNRKNEIYTFRVVPELQISNKYDFYEIPDCFAFAWFILHFFCICICSCWIWLCKNIVKWVGSGRGRLRLVQNDWTGCPEVLGLALAQNSLKTNMKKQLKNPNFLRPPPRPPSPPPRRPPLATRTKGWPPHCVCQGPDEEATVDHIRRSNADRDSRIQGTAWDTADCKSQACRGSCETVFVETDSGS